MKLDRRVGVMMVVVLLAACAPVTSDDDDGTTGTSGQETTTTSEAGVATTEQAEGEEVGLRIAGDGYGHTAATVDAFEDAHPGITVEYAEGNLNFEEGVPQALLQSGQGPDILLLNSGPGRAGELAKAGLIADLTDLYDGLDLRSIYPASLIDQLEAQGDGSFYEIIDSVSAYRVFYNKDMFEAAGVEVPTSWEELIAHCQALADSGVEPMTLGTRSGFAAGWLGGLLLASSAGPELMTDIIYSGASFDDPDVVLGFEMLQELVDGPCLEGTTAAALDWEQAFAAFYAGQAAMVAGNEFVLIGADDNGLDLNKFGSFAIPSRDESRALAYSAGPGKSWVMNAETTHPEEALAWLEWVTTEDYLRIVIDAESIVPARILPAGADLAPALAGTAEILANESVSYNPSNYFAGAGTQAWYESLQNVVTGSATPAEAAATVQEALETGRQ